MALPAPASLPPGDRPGFDEVWAYLLDGEEKYLDPAAPVTDLAYFGAGINMYGKLVGLPSRERLPATYKGRVHLVVAEASSMALTHFVLDPSWPLRDALVADLVKAAASFDGVQVDFEAVSKDDYDNFAAFIAVLKAGLGPKQLSVALPARKNEAGDRFGYERLGKIADRIVVMAYDEHWGGSEPGPVASLAWCKAVSAYALSKIAPEKLVMGLPLYGRAWADRNPAKALRYTGVAGVMADKGIGEVGREDEIPFVEYEETVKVKVYFEDRSSILARLALYRDSEVRNIGFWRLGQEDPLVWSGMQAEALGARDGGVATAQARQ